jgi:hypothetical protein
MSEKVSETFLVDDKDGVLNVGGINNPNPRIEAPAEVNTLSIFNSDRPQGITDGSYADLVIASSSVPSVSLAPDPDQPDQIVAASISRSAISFYAPTGDEGIPNGSTGIQFSGGNLFQSGFQDGGGGGFYFLPGISANDQGINAGGEFVIDLTSDGAVGQINVPVLVTLVDGGEGYPDGTYYDIANYGNIGFSTSDIENYATVCFESMTIKNGAVVALGAINYSSSNGDGPQVGDTAIHAEYRLEAMGLTGEQQDAIVRLASIRLDALSQSIGGGSFNVNNQGGGFQIDYAGTWWLDGETGSAGQALTSNGYGAAPSWNDAGSGGGGGGSAFTVINHYPIDEDGYDANNDNPIANLLHLASNSPSSSNDSAIASYSVVFPSSPSADQIFGIVSDNNVTSFTAIPDGDYTIPLAPTSLIAGQEVQWMFDSDNGFWNLINGAISAGGSGGGASATILRFDAGDPATFDFSTTEGSALALFHVTTDTTLSSLSVEFPGSAAANQTFGFVSDQDVTSVTCTPNGGDTIQNTAAALVAGDGVQWVSDGSGNWARIDGATTVVAGPPGPTGATGAAGTNGTDGTGGSSLAIVHSYNYDGDTYDGSAITVDTLISIASGAVTPLHKLTVAFPTTPTDGQRFGVVSDFDVAELAVNPGTNTLENLPDGLVAGQEAFWLYQSNSSSWQRTSGHRTPLIITPSKMSYSDAASSYNNFSANYYSIQQPGLTITPPSGLDDGQHNLNIQNTSVLLVAGDSLMSTLGGVYDGGNNQLPDISLVAGVVYASDQLGSGNLSTGGGVYAVPGASIDPVPVAFTIADGGSGYELTGVTADGLYEDFGQTRSFMIYSTDLNTRVFAKALTFTSGVLTGIHGLYCPTGVASLGDTFILVIGSNAGAFGSSYNATVYTTQATLTVSELAAASDGGFFGIYSANSQGFGFGPRGDMYMGDGSAGNPGDILVSQGAGAAAIWETNDRVTVLRAAVIDGNNYPLESYPALLMLQASTAIAAYDVDFGDLGFPLPDQEIRISTNQDIAAFGLLNATFDNVPSSLSAYQEIVYVYNSDSGTWERVR